MSVQVLQPDQLRLGSLPTAAPCARLHASAVLTEWGLSASLIEDAELIISELVTNAVNTSVTLPDRPAITLRLIPGDQALLIEVWDRSPMPVHLENPGADDEHGRGLVVVAALSYRWGCDQDETDSKVVWAELAYR